VLVSPGWPDRFLGAGRYRPHLKGSGIVRIGMSIVTSLEINGLIDVNTEDTLLVSVGANRNE